MSEELTFSNPTKSLTVEDWPSGRKQRVTCIFTVESKPGKGERISRVTMNEHGHKANPKTTTYAERVVIADGSDGKTYVLQFSQFGMVTVMDGILKYSTETAHHPSERYEYLKALIFSV